MKKLLFLLVLVGVLSINLLEAVEAVGASSGYVLTNTAYLKTTFVNQYPYPAEPGSYVDLLFKLENWGAEKAENVVFELLPQYPFSLYPGTNATKELGTIRELQNGENAFLIKYKVRVDKDAIDGQNEIGVKYTYGNGAVISTETFNVTVSNPRTDFDVVVQDSTASSTTLAIVNIGANTAYSVIVKIPEQENFRVTGTSANVIGNLNAGDYTLAGFQITSAAVANISDIREKIASRIATNISIVGEKNLAVEISYTDTLGIRRTIQKEVRLDMSGIIGAATTTRTTQSSQFQIPSGGLMYIAIGVIGIIGIAVFFKIRKRKKK